MDRCIYVNQVCRTRKTSKGRFFGGLIFCLCVVTSRWSLRMESYSFRVAYWTAEEIEKGILNKWGMSPVVVTLAKKKTSLPISNSQRVFLSTHDKVCFVTLKCKVMNIFYSIIGSGLHALLLQITGSAICIVETSVCNVFCCNR